MAFPTFTPPKAPYIDQTIETELRVKSIEYGDGYKQVTADGLNPVTNSIQNLRWTNLTLNQASNIVNFLKEQLGAPFYYLVPGDGVLRKWRCLKWSKSVVDGVTVSLSLNLEEAFEVDDI